jgi:hypothetical protein
VELFFKALKQTAKIKTFVGTSANAVRTQVWTALIAMLGHSWEALGGSFWRAPKWGIALSDIGSAVSSITPAALSAVNCNPPGPDVAITDLGLACHNPAFRVIHPPWLPSVYRRMRVVPNITEPPHKIRRGIGKRWASTRG